MDHHNIDFAVRVGKGQEGVLPGWAQGRGRLLSLCLLHVAAVPTHLLHLFPFNQNVRRVCPPGKLMCLMSDNDPYRGLDDDGQSNKRDFEEIVGARVVLRHGKGHFNSSRLDEEDTRLIETELLGLVRQKALPVEAVMVGKSSSKATSMAHGTSAQKRRRAFVTTKAKSKL